MNRIGNEQSAERLVFMDRLRLLLVVIVVFMHSAAAYTNIISWWSVQETPKSLGLDIFALFVDGFQMPLLFFIAGYFAYYSLKSRTRKEFIILKLKRIGLPFLAVAIFLNPYITYLGIKRILPAADGFFQFWLVQMKSLIDFDVVFFTSMEVAKKHWMDFSLWHLWFVVVLLLFYCIYVILNYIIEKISDRKTYFQEKDNTGFTKVLAVSFVLMALSYALVNRFIGDWHWAKIGFFSFQPSRMTVYAVVFFLGIYTGMNKYFNRKQSERSTWLWGLSFPVLSAALIACMMYVFISWDKPYPFSFSLVHGLVRAGLVISSIVFLSGIMMKLPGRPLSIDFMNQYSYEIYIIHLPLLIFVAKLFTFIALPLVLKFVLVGIIVTLTSYALGRFLVKPFPKISCCVMASVFIILCLVYR